MLYRKGGVPMAILRIVKNRVKTEATDLDLRGVLDSELKNSSLKFELVIPACQLSAPQTKLISQYHLKVSNFDSEHLLIECDQGISIKESAILLFLLGSSVASVTKRSFFLNHRNLIMEVLDNKITSREHIGSLILNWKNMSPNHVFVSEAIHHYLDEVGIRLNFDGPLVDLDQLITFYNMVGLPSSLNLKKVI